MRDDILDKVLTVSALHDNGAKPYSRADLTTIIDSLAAFGEAADSHHGRSAAAVAGVGGRFTALGIHSVAARTDGTERGAGRDHGGETLWKGERYDCPDPYGSYLGPAGPGYTEGQVAPLWAQHGNPEPYAFYAGPAGPGYTGGYSGAYEFGLTTQTAASASMRASAPTRAPSLSTSSRGCGYAPWESRWNNAAAATQASGLARPTTPAPS